MFLKQECVPEAGMCPRSRNVLASFPDSTPQLFIALCIKAGLYTQCDKKLGSGVWERG